MSGRKVLQLINGLQCQRGQVSDLAPFTAVVRGGPDSYGLDTNLPAYDVKLPVFVGFKKPSHAFDLFY